MDYDKEKDTVFKYGLSAMGITYGLGLASLGIIVGASYLGRKINIYKV